MSGTLAGDRLLDLLEPGWRRELQAGAVAAQLEAEPELAQAVARALGEQSRALNPGEVDGRWPACVVVGIARIAGELHAASGSGTVAFWPAWHRAAGLRPSARSAREWSNAFLAALGALGLPTASTAEEAVLAHATAAEDPGGADGDPADRTGQAHLDPFGGGVLLTDDVSGETRAALPEEVTAEGASLLAFDEDGALVDGPLPAEAVWVLYPANATLRSDAEVRTLVTSTLPLTWRGWRLVQVDLPGASWLALGDEASAGTGRRLVRGRTRPVLRTGPPIPGVTTADGRPVFPSLPERQRGVRRRPRDGSLPGAARRQRVRGAAGRRPQAAGVQRQQAGGRVLRAVPGIQPRAGAAAPPDPRRAGPGDRVRPLLLGGRPDRGGGRRGRRRRGVRAP